MIFTGTFELQVDAKHRMAVPSEVRAMVQEFDESGKEKPVIMYVWLGGENVLSLYTKEGFEQQAKALNNSARSTEEILEYETLMYSLAKEVELDKNGRILLPKNLLDLVGLKSDVVLIGAKDHLEIRDRATWYEYVRNTLAQKKSLLMNPRLAMTAGVPAAKE